LQRSRFLLISTAAGVTACSGSIYVPPAGTVSPSPASNLNPNGDGAGNFGATDETAAYAQTCEALPPDAFAGSFLQAQLRTARAATASTRNVLAVLPPVQTQGTPQSAGAPGSCTAQAFGYFTGTYTSALGTSRDLTKPANQVSAAWLYAYVHGEDGSTCPHGSQSLYYLERLVTLGAPSAADFPYDPNPALYDNTKSLCGYLNTASLSTAYADEQKFFTGSYKTFDAITGKMATYLPRFRKFIDAGYCIPFVGNNGAGYAQPKLSIAGVFVAPAGTAPTTDHCQVIVGYDDALGAFLVQNSFGPGWNPNGPAPGNNGRIWFDYTNFFEVQVNAAVMYPDVPAPGGGYPLTAEVTGGPAITVYSSGTYDDTSLGRYVVHFDFKASDAVRVASVQVTDPNGQMHSKTFHESIRTGYVLVEKSNSPFVSGKYGLTLNVTHAGTQYAYVGNIPVT
jgi:hypothetical protein